eukprot:TRINITY_DN61222_c0_g1_i1.p1 TRINITY_DN61222_c0_g1~~TRINITY_DN61222_c0_g1_i1.p1  ORF type:complete len:265 (+),score=24.77 TRINITY_DN61222_c0_g1_i1:102-896(+)
MRILAPLPSEEMSCSSMDTPPPKGETKKRRMRQLRSQARRVRGVCNMLQASLSHHTGTQRHHHGRLPHVVPETNSYSVPAATSSAAPVAPSYATLDVACTALVVTSCVAIGAICGFRLDAASIHREKAHFGSCRARQGSGCGRPHGGACGIISTTARGHTIDLRCGAVNYNGRDTFVVTVRRTKAILPRLYQWCLCMLSVGSSTSCSVRLFLANPSSWTRAQRKTFSQLRKRHMAFARYTDKGQRISWRFCQNYRESKQSFMGA